MPRAKIKKNIEEKIKEKVDKTKELSFLERKRPAKKEVAFDLEFSTKKKRVTAKLVLICFGGIFFVGAVFFAGYFYFQYQKALNVSGKSKQSELEKITERIGKVFDLPKNEEPTIAEVSDMEKLKGQVFFSNAKNGDKVLIYMQSKKAILYRPETEKVIEMMSLATGSSESVKANIETSKALSGENEQEMTQVEDLEKKTNIDSQSQIETEVAVSTSSEKKLTSDEVGSKENVVQVSKKIVVYNGTKTKGLAGKLGEKISTEVSGTEIVKTGNAVGNYTKTVIVDLGGGNLELAQKIQSAIGGEIGILPSDEKKPEGDILVIGGDN